MSEPITLVFDIKQRKFACVLIQAVYGCSAANGFLQQEMPTDCWLVYPTEDMRRITATREEWLKLAERLRNEKAQKS